MRFLGEKLNIFGMQGVPKPLIDERVLEVYFSNGLLIGKR